MMRTFVGAEVFLPGEIVETTVTIDNAAVVEIGGPIQGEVINARGKILAPALVDVHGDAFERQVMPRPNTYFPLDIAVIDTDRQLASNGIATAYHAITLGWEPGLRDVARGRDMIETINPMARAGPFEISDQILRRSARFSASSFATAASIAG